MSSSVIRGPIWRDGRGRDGVSVLPWGWGGHQACPALGLTSVSRTALCWARMLPRPATACGSSVMLCSPSGSASLSDSPAPLRGAHKGLSRGSLAPRTALGSPGAWCPPLPTSSPSPPYVASSSLMSCRRLMLGNFSWRSFFIPRLAPTGTTLMLLQGLEGGEDGGQEPRVTGQLYPANPFHGASARLLRLSNHRVSAAVLSAAARGARQPLNSPLRTH